MSFQNVRIENTVFLFGGGEGLWFSESKKKNTHNSKTNRFFTKLQNLKFDVQFV